MNKYFLTEIETKDKLVHQGIYFEPKERSDKAILWVHGLSSTYSSHIPTCDAFSQMCKKYHFGFAAFNNRGAKFIDGIQKRDPSDAKGYIHVQGGAGNEKFEECVYDIDAGITFLLGQGYKKIILVGRSTGANKVCFYAGTTRDPRVSGVVLMSPISDRLSMTKSQPNAGKILFFMKKQITSGKGDQQLFGFNFFPLTPKRYVSLMEKGSKEDVFDYGDEKPKMSVFGNIRAPLLVVFGSRDEYADRPVKEIKRIFDAKKSSAKYKSVIVKDALHGFDGMEKELAQIICSWCGKN